MIAAIEDHYKIALDMYRKESHFFPLIGAVLQKNQLGRLFVDSAISPTQFYAEHNSGFSQIFGRTNNSFESKLEQYFSLKKFTVAKVRLYAPYTPLFLQKEVFLSSRSFRQRLIYCGEDGEFLNHRIARPLFQEDANQIRYKFDILNRFWQADNDFFGKSFPTGVVLDGQVESICYAAAVSNGCAEIDIVTSREVRKKGFATQAAQLFIERCKFAGIKPVWDCFLNNEPSLRLALTLKFIPKSKPYNFFTISNKYK